MEVNQRGIGGHTKYSGGETDTWLTPRGIIERLGTFDLDPCAGPKPRPWPTAAIHYDKSQGEDGLELPWDGRVWLNPPYGRDVGRWLEKMARHIEGHRGRGGGSGMALVFARTETDAWGWIWPYADSVLFVRGRLHFCLPDGTVATGNAGGPSALVAYKAEDSRILAESGIAGAHVRRI